MTVSKSNGIDALVQEDQLLLAGAQKDLANQSFPINDKPCKTQDVVDVLNARISKGLAVIAARKALAAAVKEFREERANTAVFVRAFRTMVSGMFSNPNTLGDFGLAPRKAPKKTLEIKVAAVQKTAETRKARGTAGPKAKAKIHGGPTAPAVKPPVTGG